MDRWNCSCMVLVPLWYCTGFADLDGSFRHPSFWLTDWLKTVIINT